MHEVEVRYAPSWSGGAKAQLSKAGKRVNEPRCWWNETGDFDWLLAYHRSQPFLKRVESLVSAFSLMHTVLCVGLLVTPGLVVGAEARFAVTLCGVMAVAMSAFAWRGGISTKQASVVFVIVGDGGVALVLLCVTPSPFSVLASAIFTGIGNYAASFHGAKVLVSHYGFVLTVLAMLLVIALADGTWRTAALITSACMAFIILFTSSVVMQALVWQLRQDAAGAHFDPLTGLRNRRGLFSALEDVGRHQRRDGSRLWAIVLDLDGFKTVNDEFGHGFGDLVLRRTAVRIETVCPPPLITARVGGEEFTIVGTGTESDALRHAERILATVYDDRDQRPVTASIGVATMPAGQLSQDVHSMVSSLSARADAAMYEAKRSGGHRVAHSS